MCVVVVMVNVGGPDSLQLALVVFFYLQITNVFNLDPLHLHLWCFCITNQC